ncbi:MAG: hypothetical protein ACPGWR_24460 [Ardenticatenaceae bacterium]
MSNQQIAQQIEQVAAQFNTRPIWRDEAFPGYSFQPMQITDSTGRKKEWEAYKIYFVMAMNEIPLTHCEVPLDNLIITQEYVYEKRVEEYMSGQESDYPPIVWEWRGKLYLADGHHRSLAKLRQGNKTIQAMVHHLPDRLCVAA